jgi:hypothetical protein
VAATYTNIQAMFKERYGNWIDPLPESNTLAELGTFIPGENRPGLGYNFPVLTGIEHGQTPDISNSAFSINPAIDSNIVNARLDGATILLQSVVSYDVIYKSLNGAGNGNQGGAFKTALDQMVEAMLRGAELYREIALGYGPGTATAAASNIGVVNTTAAALSTHPVVILTAASWIPGLWIMMQNALVDLYQSDGTTPRELGVTVEGRPNPARSWITLFKSGIGTLPTANDIIVPYQWRLKSCYGLEAIFNNTGTLFGINASLVAPWRCSSFASGGQLTRAKIMGYCAQISVNGATDGFTLLVSAATFADLAEEAAALQRYTGNTDKVKRQGASHLTYETAAGLCDVKVWQLAKQGQAFGISSDNFRRVGSTDITMRPIGGMGDEGFFTHLTDRAGAQMKVFSNQAPVFEMPFRNFIITGIANSGSSGAAVI